jgi:hypothetical protein
MFKLRFFDCDQVEVMEGDIVKIYAGNATIFYSEVKYLEDEKVIVPFHNFAWYRFKKVDTIPLFAIKSDESRFDLWYEPDAKHNYKVPQELIWSWKDCEVLLEKRCWQITKD